ncbi:post-GPI attachment to proteins factor 4-like isoform X2 [Mercenaria mercenaria]|uniref:post-GPI attachment to proteins factor 4-like isoform X2 n=1 Tax=Mercenaria mercenaria TaxID=6596 RepID=UPI00234F37D8|nr:post-GPI attachment to proteins factor 4-like isoform X2 [Mercenaria mercenaria]XP_045212377.2 post-GPI attachment to proteins factor 4-like isoform X2 [Mercenaria mercenaria]XP_045212378.2 post-GPI attachment to proteins factor 4-like isoform X2 [Mercenaria mercenaria]
MVFQYWRRILTKFTNAKLFVRFYAVTFLIVVPFCSIIKLINDFQQVNAIISENGKRVTESKAVLSDMKPIFDTHGNFLSSSGFKNDQSCSLAISIITVSRDRNLTEADKPHYIIQSVAAFLRVIQQSGIDDIRIHFSVCNVDINPESHTDMRDIPKWITVYQRNAKPGSKYKSFFEKEKEDYIFCLQKGLEQNTSYMLVTEDDALPHSELLTVIKEKILTKEKCAFKQRNLQNVLYIKLFTNNRDTNFIRTWYKPTALLEFGIDMRVLYELILLSLVFTGILLIICKKYTKTRMSTYSKFLLIIYVICVLTFIERRNIRMVWRYILGISHEISSAPAGSFVAMLYPRDGVYNTVSYLSSSECSRVYAKDLVLNDMGRDHWKQVLYIEPSLFTHIGYKRSRHHTRF